MHKKVAAQLRAATFLFSYLLLDFQIGKSAVYGRSGVGK